MSDNSRSPFASPSFALPAFVAAAVALYGWLTYQPPLETARQSQQNQQNNPYPPPPVPKSFDSVYARLWEDPLDAAVRHSDSDKSASRPDASAWTRWKALFSDIVSDKDSEASDIGTTMLRICESTTKNGKSLLVLPVYLPGGPSVDDTEQRKRIHYAVLSALHTCGYRMKFSERMTWVDLQIHVSVLTNGKNVKTPIALPIKLFTPDEVEHFYDGEARFGGVLALWLNESLLGSRPLDAMSQILDDLFGTGNADKQELRIIGPVTSDTLMMMAAEDWSYRPPEPDCSKQPKEPILKNWGQRGKPVLLCGRATISAQYLKNQGSNAETMLECFLSGGETGSGLRVVRTIGTDALLVGSLEEELKLRGAWPRQDRTNECIVLITEKDTLYGRSLPRVFAGKFGHVNADDESCPDLSAYLEVDEGPNICKKVNGLAVYTFLRGIDGAVPTKSALSTDARRDDPEEKKRASRSDVPATGGAQLDYLRRLERSLAEIDDWQRRHGGRGIVAIGVVGTDLYDKFLVLRALRGRFRDACFFTTDLDAQMTDPLEQGTAQNLIVASHFGLTLHSSLQRDVAPFRDSYQTACFLSTLMALDDHRLKIRHPTEQQKEWPWSLWPAPGDANEATTAPLKPLVFEIGAERPYQLTQTQGSGVVEFYQPASPRESRFGDWPWTVRWLSLVLFGLLATLTVRPVQKALIVSRPRTHWVYIAAFLAVTVGMWLSVAADHRHPGGEPFTLFDGISIWPATILRYLAFCLAIVFLLVGMRDLQRNEQEKIVRKFTGTLRPPPPMSFWDRVWMRASDENCSVNECYSLYSSRSKWSPTAIRVGVASLAWLLFAGALLWVFGYPRLPYRGSTSYSMSMAMLIGSAISTLVLSIFVLDATELCRRFIRQLAERTEIWPIKRTADYSKKPPEAAPTIEHAELLYKRHEVNFPELSELLKIRLIAERTTAVSKLVIYPSILFLVLALARHPSFDWFPLTIPIVLLTGFLVVSILATALLLRAEASRAKTTSIARSQDCLANALAVNDDARTAEIKNLIDEIKSENRGAFRPFAQDPILRALAIPLGGMSTLLAVEYFAQ